MLGVVLFFVLGDIERQLMQLQAHVTAELVQRFVAWALHAITPSRAHLASAVLIVDAVISGVEGWALHTRKVWGEWLVVGATGSLIPLEIYSIFEHQRVTRDLVLIINVAVVAYLARRQWLRRGLGDTREI